MALSPTLPHSEARWHGTTVRLLAGDITLVSVDAPLTAANSALAGGDRVDGAIHDEPPGRIRD